MNRDRDVCGIWDKIMTAEIPYFIQVRGCINCDVYQHALKENSGFNHERVVGCVIKGCYFMSVVKEERGGYTCYRPFIDPEEIMKRARETNNTIYIKNAQNYCRKLQEVFGEFYKHIGVDLDTIIQDTTS